ncbi:MAG: class I SAM-dependent methyltransferase [Deltaproteobacteria bacterium]|nr:class I SAM-dependent methyltransferase [Deltaproteobacteria bacterium]
MTDASDSSPVEIKEKIKEAALRRQMMITSFTSHTNAWRLIHSGADGFDGITVDVLDDVLLVEQHREHADISHLLQELPLQFPDKSIFVKKRWSRLSEHRCGEQVAGPRHPHILNILENDLRFGIRLTDEEHIGLFLDSRMPREWVRANSTDKRVLNLFSYTGGFGVAAAAGGAVNTVNIDNKNSALRYAEQNYQKNGLPFDSRTFFKCDVLYYLKRAAGQKGRFDLIVVDPPPRFKRRHQRDFVAHRDYHKLIALCIGVLAPGGTILAGLNALKASDEQMDTMIEAAAMESHSTITTTGDITAPPDFPSTPDRPVSRFRILRVSHTPENPR